MFMKYRETIKQTSVFMQTYSFATSGLQKAYGKINELSWLKDILVMKKVDS
jgi:hypothetical protein